MKKLLFYSLAIVILGSFYSCSTDADDDYNPDQEIIGVWEQEGFLNDSGYRLVFASDYSGIHIYRKVDDDGVTSSAIMINWERGVNGSVIISEGFGFPEPVTLVLNSDGQLVLENQNILPFDKISDTTLDY